MTDHVIVNRNGSRTFVAGYNGWFELDHSHKLVPYQSKEDALVHQRVLSNTGLGDFEVRPWPLPEPSDVEHLVGLGMRRRLAEALVRLAERLDLED